MTEREWAEQKKAARRADYKQAVSLHSQGLSVVAVGERLWPDVPKEVARKRASRLLLDKAACQAAQDEGERAEALAPSWEPMGGGQVGACPLPSGLPRGDDYPRVEGDFLLLSDTHVPYHDGALIERAVARAKSLGVGQWCIIGDFLDGNQWSKRGLSTTFQRRWQDDAEVGASLLEYLVAEIGPGLVLSGNHDAWFLKHFRGQAEAEWLLTRLFCTKGNVVWSGYEQAVVTSGGRELRLLHGANYSAMSPLTVGQRLAAKYEQGIVMGHQHHACQGRSWSGKHQVVCLGGAYRPEMFRYVHESPRTNPTQTRSWAILKDGYVEVREEA